MLVEEVPEVLAVAAKNASREGGGKEMRPIGASAAPSANAFRAASEIFSSALAREIQRADSPAVNWFWRIYDFARLILGC